VIIARCAAGTMCCAAVLSLAACAGTPMQPTASHAASSHQFANRHSLPSHDVLYVSDPIDTRVDIYPLNSANPPPIGSMTIGLFVPTGMALDASHTLYVANNSAFPNGAHFKGAADFVMTYEAGASVPEAAYWLDLRNPTDVKVGPDGTAYVAGLGDGFVTEYSAGSNLPSQHFHPPSGSALALTLDAQNNLYVACANSNAVFKFAPGSTQGTNLGLVINGEPHGMAVDKNGNLLVAVSAAPSSGSVVDVFAPGKTTPSAQIGGVFQPFMIALDRSEHHLYVADYGSGNHDGGVFEFSYPSGTLISKYVQGAASEAYGVAVNPPAPF
jgi:DNA-binding beta-propeller fold protein YncE